MNDESPAIPGPSLEPAEPQLLWSFVPDPAAAAALSDEIARRLVGSLRYVFGDFGEWLGCDGDHAESWIEAIEHDLRADPLIHTFFHALVARIEGGDRDGARALAARLLTRGRAGEGLAILPLDPGEADPRPAPLIRPFADLEEENRLDLIPPDPATVPAATVLIEEGLALVGRNDPALDGEFRAMVSEIWLVGQAPGHRFTTAAVSCFQTWGGLIVNPAVHHVPLDVVELVAHEATHLLLFAIALDEPLLTNAPEERFHSPLREAPRSMDGVFHATIVAARIIRAMLSQAEAEGRQSRLGQDALDRAARCVQLFEEGVEIIESGARLTPLGRRVLDDSRAFVDANKAAIPANAEQQEPATVR